MNRTSFAGGALGFNIPEIANLLEDGITEEHQLINYVDNKLIAGPCQDNETSFWKKADNNIYKENKQFVIKEGNDKNNIIKSVCM